MMSRVIAITGQSGSGKTTISKYYRENNYTVVDCDEIAKNAHNNADCLKELVKEFSEDILVNGKLDKKELSKKAFINKQTIKKLTDITHPFIIQDILKEVNKAKANKEKIIFVDGAVIINHDFEKYCDEFIVVISEIESQLKRIMERDNISLEKAQLRIKNQDTNESMLKKANYVIENNSTLENLILSAQSTLKKILK